MEKRVTELINRHRLFKHGEKIVVAVSGGPDSICLLHVLHELSASCSWSLVVAHLDHGFRGAASRADSEFVRCLAEELGWPAAVKHVDVPGWLKRHGGSAQDASRRLRYAFLREVAESHGAESIALAHNQGDQAETVLLHLLRGAGANGLAGMRYLEASGSVKLVRPLLTSSRDDIMQYLKHHKLSFRVDESNTQLKYTRNRLRQTLMPVMREINPEVEAAIARTAGVLQAETDLLAQEALHSFGRLAKIDDHLVALDLTGFGALPLAMQRRVLRLAYTRLLGDDRDLGLSNVDEAIALLDRPVGTTLDWPRNLVCQLGYSQLQISAGVTGEEFSVPLPLPGCAIWGSGEEIVARIIPRAELTGLGDGKSRVCLDRRSLRSDMLQIRNWREGDRFQPLGMQGCKKLQDFFVDLKIDRWDRPGIPLVTAGEEIVWVAGLRLDHRFRVTPCTTEVVCLEYTKNKI